MPDARSFTALGKCRTLDDGWRMRRWPIWISLLLLALTLGWYWLLSSDLTFTRLDEGKPEKKTDTRKG